jgi:hypothetical protein
MDEDEDNADKEIGVNGTPKVFYRFIHAPPLFRQLSWRPG